MSSSLEKVPAAVQGFLADPTLELPVIVRGLAGQLLPGMLANLPDDPDVLDDALARIAEQVLGLRSDTAPEVELIRHA